MKKTDFLALCAASLALACQDAAGVGGNAFGGEDATDQGTGGEDGDGGDGGSEGGAPSSDGPDDGIRFDVGGFDDVAGGGTAPDCKVVDGMDAVGECEEKAPPDSFEPDVQWEWTGPSSEKETITTPLVVNLTDDNDDGVIDLCDVPDVVVLVGGPPPFYDDAYIHVLDGATGAEHMGIPTPLHYTVSPAVGDIDNDGEVGIVAAVGQILPAQGRITAFDTDGSLMWTNPTSVLTNADGDAIALADLDNDGDVEIFADRFVLDHEGNTVFEAPPQSSPPESTAVTAADLDGDGDLEVVLGQSAYHHDGTEYYRNDNVPAAFPQIANLDDDPEPEILVTADTGVTVLEHDGTIKYLEKSPQGTNPAFRPAAIHDFDGDSEPEFSVGGPNSYMIYEPDPALAWTAVVEDESGWAASTAFDFDGDGFAEAMYADESTLYVFDAGGSPLLSVPRSSRTAIEYPVVADVDDDGSAEIVVVSGRSFSGQQTSPTVQVIRDVEDRWIQARRIWNQHAYHVTNVREDGTIPQSEPPSWTHLNTFRTNAQIEGGALCEPVPEG